MKVNNTDGEMVLQRPIIETYTRRLSYTEEFLKSLCGSSINIDDINKMVVCVIRNADRRGSPSKNNYIRTFEETCKKFNELKKENKKTNSFKELFSSLGLSLFNASRTDDAFKKYLRGIKRCMGRELNEVLKKMKDRLKEILKKQSKKTRVDG
jgi:hypothetical protein